MHYKWDSSFESGHETIDSQHKQLVAALNNLVEASDRGHGSEVIFKTLDFLVEYTLMHFGTEEKLQKQHGYPEYAAHKKLHDAFRTTVKDAVSRFNIEGESEALVKSTTAAIWGWLKNHIQGQDLQMAAFIKSKGA